MKVLITGAAGEVAKGGFCECLSQNYEIFYTDIRNLKIKNFVKVNLKNPSEIKKLPSDIDVLIHMAAIGEPAEVEEIYSTNIISTLNLLEYYKNKKLKKFIYFSSVCVYGLPGSGVFPDYLPIDEDHPHKAVDSYGISKSLTEKLLGFYIRKVNFDLIILRPGAIIVKEPRNYSFRLNLLKNDKTYREGGELWNYIDVRDLARAVKCVIDKKTEKFEVFNLTAPDHLLLKKNSSLIPYLKNFKGKIRKREFLERRESFFDISKFVRKFNFKFLFTIERYLKWIEKKDEQEYYLLKR
ncbi:NAD(P)-dependent oxidoreductase [bacterium]|nr:NAD(P)-dependent oxidoreductase [bacterium]